MTRFSDLPATDQLTLSLAKAALIAYVGDSHETAIKAVRRIHDECGPDALDLAMCAWADWMRQALGISADHGRPVTLEFAGADASGAPATPITGADAVTRPEVVWAGRLIAARIAKDVETYWALIAALPEDDPAAVGRHVAAVLEVSALTMRLCGVTP